METAFDYALRTCKRRVTFGIKSDSYRTRNYVRVGLLEDRS